jgi:hypothetical protein
VAIERRHSCRHFPGVLFKGIRIRYIHSRADIAKRRLNLVRINRMDAGSADQDSSKDPHRQLLRQ